MVYISVLWTLEGKGDKIATMFLGYKIVIVSVAEPLMKEAVILP
jgi:hypothetical protein